MTTLTIETATNQTELNQLVEQVLSDCMITGHNGETYEETANRLEKEAIEEHGNTNHVDDVVEFLREANDRWFELEV